MRLLNLDPRRFPIGRAAAGFSFSLSFEKSRWLRERINGEGANGDVRKTEEEHERDVEEGGGSEERTLESVLSISG